MSGDLTRYWRVWRVSLDQVVGGGGEGAWDMMAEPDMIRTPDQRVRVFVSSTLGELAAERQAVRDAVTRLRLVPVMFELGVGQGRSWRARPSGWVAIWELACEVLEAIVQPRQPSHLGDDPEGERVAPDASEVLAEQVGGSLAIAGGRGADDLDVVAFPVHLPATVTLA